MAIDLKSRVKAARSSTPSHLYPLWTAWRLAQGSNLNFSDEAIQLGVDILKRRQASYKHMRNSPSLADHCVRASVFSYLGYKSSPVDIATQHRFDQGNFGHLRWQMFLYDMGVLERAEVPMFYPDLSVAGTCDGSIDIPLGSWWNPSLTREEVRYQIDHEKAPHWHGLLEIKQMFSFRWKTNKSGGQPEPKVRWQGDLYAMCGERVDENIQGMCYWLENKDTNEICEWELAPTELSKNNFNKYYKDVMKNIKSGTLPARPYEDGSRECNYCFFADHCHRFEKKGRIKIAPAKGATQGDFKSVK